jgi:hypothetical protein
VGTRVFHCARQTVAPQLDILNIVPYYLMRFPNRGLRGPDLKQGINKGDLRYEVRFLPRSLKPWPRSSRMGNVCREARATLFLVYVKLIEPSHL